MSYSTLSDVLADRAAHSPDEPAYVFLPDRAQEPATVTWSQLAQAALRWGALLQERGAGGKPVLLALPSGLELVSALFGCWAAQAIAVPVSLPRHPRTRDRLESVIADAGVRIAIGATATRLQFQSGAKVTSLGTAIEWLDPQSLPASCPGPLRSTTRSPLALLQYTSGSTGSPRGVMVSHANLLHNSALIAQALGHQPGETIAGWLPLFHDMGLIGLIVQAAFAGMRCVFMPPERFVMRPWLWLRMLSDYRACTSPAPNFAYDLCLERVTDEHLKGIDLSAWRNALDGSEPVRAATLARFAARFRRCGFRADALYPCYGLAESTLFVTGPGPEERREWTDEPPGSIDCAMRVGCGRPFGDTELAIVDPLRRVRLPEGEVGEIWVRGGSVAEGYWRNAQATAETFGGVLESSAAPSDGRAAASHGWLRTGDLGYLASGQLFITGRLRELIILAGRNLFPADLERSVETADPAILASGAATFSIEVQGQERLVVLAEVRQRLPGGVASTRERDPESIRRRVRAALTAEHDVSAHDVVLVHANSLARTSSGKLRRGVAREAYLTGTLDVWEPDARAAG